MTLLSPDYIWFWLITAIVVAVIFAIPLYGIWYEMKRDNDYIERVTGAPIDDEIDDLYDERATQ